MMKLFHWLWLFCLASMKIPMSDTYALQFSIYIWLYLVYWEAPALISLSPWSLWMCQYLGILSVIILRSSMKFWWKNPRNQFLSKPNCKTFCFNILRLKSEFETSGSIPLHANVFLSLFVDLSVHWIKHFSKFVWFKLVPVLWLCLLHYSSVWRYCFKYIKCSTG